MPYWLLKKLTAKAPYLMSYFHPSDFDPDQPNMPQLSYMRQFKNRVALKGSYEKFKHYISDFDFVSLKKAVEVIDWEKYNTIHINNI